MKKLFFTSDTKHYHEVDGIKVANEIDNINGLVNQLKDYIANYGSILYIASSPGDKEKVDSYSKLIFAGFRHSGITFENYLILDDRTCVNAENYVRLADVIFLSGGDTYIENEFFKKLKLGKLLKNYTGVVIGQSAGSINLSCDVYNSPEEMNNSEPIYFEGLGLSNINIEPHFVLDSSSFDEQQLYQRNHILEESRKRTIYALCDGSHIIETEEFIEVFGKSYIIKDGIISLICDDKESYIISEQNIKVK